MAYMYGVTSNIRPVNWPFYSAKKTKEIVCVKMLVDISPWISVSVEESWAKEEVEVDREGANLRLHLTSIPHSWSLLVVLMPRIQNLVRILSDE